MSVRIAQASIDENGKAKGGAAGNQSGKELNIRNWYSKPWSFCLRCRDAAIADKIAKLAEDAVGNRNIGYDQNQRNTLHTLARQNGYKLAAVGKCETDCSALATCCAIGAGVFQLEYSGNAPTTATMKRVFSDTGMFDILSTETYTSKPDFLRRGDILVKPNSHTVIVLDNGSAICGNSGSKFATSDIAVPTVKNGSVGANTKALQRNLNACGAKLAVDGEAGKLTISALVEWQKKNGLVPDGIYGKKSQAKMIELLT